MDFGPVRQYLSQPPRASALEVMRDAVLLLVPGAVFLLNYILQCRVNRRTRRRAAEVCAAFNMRDRPRWFGPLCQQLWNLYRLSINQCCSFSKSIQNTMFLRKLFAYATNFLELIHTKEFVGFYVSWKDYKGNSKNWSTG